MNDRELLLRLYQDNRTQARFHETQRSHGTGLIAAGAAAILTAITHDQKITLADLPLAILLATVGLFGLFFCQKEYERMRLHLRRAEHFLAVLDATDRSFNIVGLKEYSDAAHRRRYFISSRFRLNFFWQIMHGLIFAFGAILVHAIIAESNGIMSLLLALKIIQAP